MLASAYGGPSAREILATVPQRVQSVVDGLRGGIEAGEPSLQRLATLGEPDRTAAQLAAFLTRMPSVESALGAVS